MILFDLYRKFRFLLENVMKTELNFNHGLDEFLVLVIGIKFVREEKGIEIALFAF